MKKFLLLLLIVGVAQGFISGATFSNSPVKGVESANLWYLNETIPTSSYIEKTIYDVGGYSSFVINLYSMSAGSITTANVDWFVYSAGSLVTVNSTVQSLGVAISDFKSDIVRIRLNSNQAASVTVTGNILFKYLGAKTNRKVIGNLSMDIPASSTTVTVTPATQGYWYFRTNQKMYVDFAGGTASSDDTLFNANDAFDSTPVFFKSGDIVKMIADSTTANVRGFVYE